MFTENANRIFERAIADYHRRDDVDQPMENPFEAGSIDALLYHKCWIDTVQWHLEDIIRDPYVLEFLGFSDDTAFRESDLEQALITHLQKFLLELGRGFAFEARQKRITFDGRHFYIDLVFYNYLMRCFVLIDLKTDDLTHQDLGQMQMYVNYYTRELMNEGDNPPIGIVLCADKSDSIVEYTLPEDNDQVFAAKYLPYLPSKEELARELSAEYRAINEATNGEVQG